jgi:hypothetical protein
VKALLYALVCSPTCSLNSAHHSVSFGTRGLFNKERSLFGVPALGIFKIIISWA